MTDEKLLISIITPYYDCLDKTMTLAFGLIPQLKDNIEWIIIDDGCHEKELDNYHDINKNIKIIHLEQNSGGASVPRNVGLDNAKGKYICFIDGDDVVFPNYIEKILQKINEEDFDYCYYGWKSPHYTILINKKPPEWNTCVWNCVYKRELIGEERFDPKLIIAEDYDFNKRVRKGKVTSINEILYYYNDNPNSLTKKNL